MLRAIAILRGGRLAHLLVLTLMGCRPVLRSAPQHLNDEATSVDSVLFEIVIRSLEWPGDRTPVRVDPRPLRPDPRIVSLWEASAVGPFPDAPDTLMAEAPEQAVAWRKRAVARAGVSEADAFATSRCPGILRRADKTAEDRIRFCPRTRYKSVLVALPRRGGPYVPGYIDERMKYGDSVFSVRVISRGVGPLGSSESSDDVVFRRMAERWTIVAKKNLAILE